MLSKGTDLSKQERRKEMGDMLCSHVQHSLETKVLYLWIKDGSWTWLSNGAEDAVKWYLL